MNLDELRDRIERQVDELRDRYAALPEDRQRQVRLGAITAAVALPILLIVLPLVVGRVDATSSVANATEQLEEMRQLEVAVLERGLNESARTRSARRPASTDESLLGTADAIARKLKINRLVQSMRPVGGRDQGADAVEIQMKGLVLGELVDLLYELEVEEEGLTVRKLEVQKDIKEPTTLRVNLEVAR